MAGHSQFKNIMVRKGAQDARRGRLFTKIIRELTTAAKPGRPTPTPIPAVRGHRRRPKPNMPKDTIDRAIKKGTGEPKASTTKKCSTKATAPAASPSSCDILTDNRNRTAAEVRKLFEMAGGKLGETGCVAWMFDRKGVLVIPGRAPAKTP